MAELCPVRDHAVDGERLDGSLISCPSCQARFPRSSAASAALMTCAPGGQERQVARIDLPPW